MPCNHLPRTMDPEMEKLVRELVTVLEGAGLLDSTSLATARAMLREVDAYKLAHAFERTLRRHLSAADFEEGQRRNRSTEYREHKTCASGDFLDSNVVMAEAFAEVFARDVAIQDPADTTLWNEAWDLFRLQGGAS